MENKREKNLLKNTITIMLGKVSVQFINFILLPLYTALLSTEEYGAVDVVNTIAFLLAPIVTFQIEQALFRFLIENRDDDNKKKEIISSVFGCVLVQIFIFFVIYCVCSNFFTNQYRWYLLLYVIVYILFNLLLQLARGLGDNILFTIASTLTALCTIVGNILFIAIIKLGAKGMLLAGIWGYLFGALYIIFKLQVLSYINIRNIKKKSVNVLLGYSIPLIPNAISWWIFNASDRLIVNVFLGTNANGILAIVHKFPQIYVALYSIFNISWTESASIHINDSDVDEYFTGIIDTCMKIFICICMMILVTMPFLFPILINKQYQEAYKYIPILMLASVGNVGVGLISVIYIALKDSKAVAKTSVMSAILNIVIHVLAIKKIGLYASVVSTFAAYYIMFFYRAYDIKRKVGIRFNYKFYIFASLVSIVLLVAYYSNNLRFQILMVIFISFFSVYINKNIFYVVSEMILKKLRQ